METKIVNALVLVLLFSEWVLLIPSAV